MIVGVIRMKVYSTAEVARMVGVNKLTLLRWLYAGRLKEPKRGMVAGADWRIWTTADVRRAMKVKKSMKPGRKPGSQRGGAK